MDTKSSQSPCFVKKFMSLINQVTCFGNNILSLIVTDVSDSVHKFNCSMQQNLLFPKLVVFASWPEHVRKFLLIHNSYLVA